MNLSICDVIGNESWILHYIFAEIVYLNRTPTKNNKTIVWLAQFQHSFLTEEFQRYNGVIGINKLHINALEMLTLGYLLIASLLRSIYLALFKVTVNIHTLKDHKWID